MNILHEITGCPGFFLDHPFDSTEREKSIWSKNCKDLIKFLEKISGRKMDWDKLSQNVAEMDKQIKLQAKSANCARPYLPPSPPAVSWNC